MRKIILFLAVCLISMASFAGIIDSGDINENITWTLDDEGTLTINGTGEMPNYTSGNRPPWYLHKYNAIKPKKVIIDNGITSIGDYAFADCFSIIDVEIPNSVISIGNRAFSQCQIENIEIPNSVQTIKAIAFGNTRITTLEIPNSVTYIGIFAFNISTLENVIVSWANPSNVTVENGVFGETNIPASCFLKVPAGTKELYEKANVWKDFQIIEHIPTSLTDIKEKSTLNIYTTDKTIFVENVKDSTIAVYSTQGQLITSAKNVTETFKIVVPQAGIYIVRVGGESWKVVVN